MTKKSSYYKSEFFDDAKGNKSITRLKSFLAAITALIIALSRVFFNIVSLVNNLPIIIALLAFSVGEKSFQYFLVSILDQYNYE
ncbi:MAG: hypothetical protein COW63_17575 [Bacteroidetes bacterium CG18_big_fil_WC_8_21_14_2_50_41_14]|nr:MAG: hypothetical protein COW63_17575 [Bacteroidetes bacterium CG18_big_fil_WC_8_21_14_2_50_41_14]PIY31612.1 MAG: hypothetical protein COZ08_08540 [Bacteroidetes bacterium CG_4_10_14_3_um_filter_42_6]PJB55053.1 MAG: hypothetical protein CO098_18375 [Bacteroidetes bacterium CG_4_9_14_3_um_filter_41_19]